MSNTSGAAGTPLAQRGVAIRGVDELMRLAEILYKGGVCPRSVGRPEAAAAVILMGQEVGLSPVQALQSIMIAAGKNGGGRMTMWGDALLALVRSSGKLESILEGVQGEGDSRHGRCAVTRKGEPERVFVFSVADAKRAGLWTKDGPWQQYPDRMLLARARGFALRDVFPDVLCGLVSTEEVDDLPETAPSVRVVDPPTVQAPALPAAAPALPSSSSGPQPAAEPGAAIGELMVTDATLQEIARLREAFMLRHARVQPANKELYAGEWQKVLRQHFAVDSARALTEQQAQELVRIMASPAAQSEAEMRAFF